MLPPFRRQHGKLAQIGDLGKPRGASRAILLRAGCALEGLATHSAGLGVSTSGDPSLAEPPARAGCYRVRGALTPIRTSKFSGGMGLGGTGRWVPGAGRVG